MYAAVQKVSKLKTEQERVMKSTPNMPITTAVTGAVQLGSEATGSKPMGHRLHEGPNATQAPQLQSASEAGGVGSTRQPTFEADMAATDVLQLPSVRRKKRGGRKWTKKRIAEVGSEGLVPANEP